MWEPPTLSARSPLLSPPWRAKCFQTSGSLVLPGVVASLPCFQPLSPGTACPRSAQDNGRPRLHPLTSPPSGTSRLARPRSAPCLWRCGGGWLAKLRTHPPTHTHTTTHTHTYPHAHTTVGQAHVDATGIWPGDVHGSPAATRGLHPWVVRGSRGPPLLHALGLPLHLQGPPAARELQRGGGPVGVGGRRRPCRRRWSQRLFQLSTGRLHQPGRPRDPDHYGWVSE